MVTGDGSCEAYIAIAWGVGLSFVSAVIQRLSQEYPRIVIHLVTAYAGSLRQQLSERNVDLLIAARWGSLIDERLDFEFLFDDPIVIVAGAQSRWARKRKIELADLVNEPWVLPPPPGSVVASFASETFRASGLDYPRTIVVTESPQARFNLPATGSFLTMFRVSALRFPTRRTEVKALRVQLPMASAPIGPQTALPAGKTFAEARDRGGIFGDTSRLRATETRLCPVFEGKVAES
jgi:DNA-binding transcriptional LysR family regulator